MNILYIEDKQILVDEDGFLENLSDWTPQVAESLAQRQGIVLSELHWEVIHATRAFYQQYAMSPNQRPFVKYIRQTLGTNKGTSRYLMKLFPGSPAKLASLIAGIPKPSHCF